MKKVITIGLDGFEPKIVDALLAMGELPNLARLREQGGFSRIRTTYPAQTPVAWSTFATSTNPGGHGIFDFIRRDPKTYLPDLRGGLGTSTFYTSEDEVHAEESENVVQVQPTNERRFKTHLIGPRNPKT